MTLKLKSQIDAILAECDGRLTAYAKADAVYNFTSRNAFAPKAARALKELIIRLTGTTSTWEMQERNDVLLQSIADDWNSK